MKRIVLLLTFITLGVILGFQTYPFWQSLALILAFFTVVWLVSLIFKNTGIVDIFWGLTIVAIAWLYRFYINLDDLRSLVFCVIVSIWGARLSIHLFLRNLRRGEDFRYQEWRKQHGSKWGLVSYYKVFLVQGYLLWIVSTVFAPAMSSNFTGIKTTDYVGMAVWMIGFLFEFISDWQLSSFRKNPENNGQVLQTGLWGVSRHPNYFGEALQWWGYFLFACTTFQYQYVFSPLIMTILLITVSGIVPVEKRLLETKPDYAKYKARVSAFFPVLF